MLYREAINKTQYLNSYVTFHKELTDAVSTLTFKDSGGMELVPVMWPGDLSKSKVYVCGYEDQVLAMYQHIYPEHKHKIERARSFKDTMINKITNKDVLLVGNGSGCDRNYSSKWYEQNIKGTVIIFNGERNYHAFQDLKDVNTIPRNQYHLGYKKDGCQTARMYFMSYFFTGQKQLWNYFLQPQNKPKSSRQHFVVYTAGRCVSFREEAFDAIATANPSSKAYFAGKCSGTQKLNNIIKYDAESHDYKDNFIFYKKFKFCLVMENTFLDGYISEKILLAFAGGCVPIYYGTMEIFDIFNPKSFIYYDINNPELALQEISRLHSNSSAYDEVMAEPILLEGTKTIQKYFSLSDQIIEDAMLKKKIRNLMYTRCKR